MYLNYLKSVARSEYISSSAIARALGYGEVTVRKDLSAVSGEGRPRVGYLRKLLVRDVEEALGLDCLEPMILVGAGSLGNALMGYPGFQRFGFSILAAFDDDPSKQWSGEAPPILPMSRLSGFCRANRVVIGIITVPEAEAQKVCDEMLAAGITEIWNFAPCRLKVPEGVTVQQENLALSVANLHMCAKRSAHRISQTEQKGTHDEGTELPDC